MELSAHLSLPVLSAFASLTVFTALMLWLTVIVGTYIIFPPYRVTPPPGTTDLRQFPRAFVLANASIVWCAARLGGLEACDGYWLTSTSDHGD